MRKLLFGAVATAMLAVQPNLALAQRVPSNFIKEAVSATEPIITTKPTANILQAIPVSATNAGLPVGVLDTSRCVVGTPTGVAQGTFEHIRFVGNVLCIDPGPEGQFLSFAASCSAGLDPVVQGVKLIKTEARIPKCPDVYPGFTIVQTPVSTGIRTWWPLKYTPCDTTFLLEVEYGCVNRTLPRRVVEVRVDRWTFKVNITASTLSWVVQALHNQPLGVCEVPCITDEGLFDLLVRQSDTIRDEAAAGASRIRNLNTAIDLMEATIVARCLFLVTVAQVNRDAAGNITSINACGALPGFANGPYGNFTIADLGYGIVDTLEHPCCCKLIADLYCLKNNLIGRDP